MRAVLLSCAALLLLAASEAPRPVRVTPVVIAPVQSALVYSGTVQARHQVDLAFRVGGRVIARPVDVGDHVKAGQVLARLDEEDLRLSEEAAAAAMAAADADADNARAELARYDRLGAASPAFLASEADKRRAASRMASARLLQAARQLSLARSQRSYGALLAEADGVVTALPVQVGQVVAAGQTVATVARTDTIEVVADVPENRLADVRAAAEARVILWAVPDHPLAGTVREMGALADPVSRTFAVRIALRDPPADILALGMTATVVFGRPSPPLARLPATALTDRAGAPAMWVLDPQQQRAILRPVTLAGYGGDGSVLVVDGLHPGDLVVTAGVGQITADMALAPWPGAAR